ncbi:hypothetical protein HGA64_04880 [Candidatus Falkowbacteria bacterium]|nr:hypothetical protein [Candidatus Falkowbacteria bacterium]
MRIESKMSLGVQRPPEDVTKNEGVMEKAKEKIASFVEFKQLKLREYFGKIDEGQLQSLLELELEQVKKDIPVIPGVFDPKKALENLRTLPRDQKQKALADFKSKLVRQRQALAVCRNFLKRKIEINNDVDRSDLIDWIDKFSKEYGFTPEQIDLGGKIVEKYYDVRQEIKRLRAQYENDWELARKILGQDLKPGIDIKVEVGPMSIDIFCDGPIVEKFSSKAYPTISNKTGGFASIALCGDKRIPYTVIRTDIKNLSIKTHEHQHVENILFIKGFDGTPDMTSLDLWREYKNEVDPNLRKELLESYLKSERNDALKRVKDEFIAMKKEGAPNNRYDIWFRQDSSSYDYLSDVREKGNGVLFKNYSEKILVEEYKKIIERGMQAFDQLVKIGKCSTDEAIALLTDKPFTQWPKTVRRLLEEI